eukprot:GHRR01030802.1.p1 GENE.GHRR01030802.1~~GHRR01030802.1.p1  ORF type:complete len:100 (+),score=13.05 GHRR01030802.1:1195-1494(+)
MPWQFMCNAKGHYPWERMPLLEGINTAAVTDTVCLSGNTVQRMWNIVAPHDVQAGKGQMVLPVGCVDSATAGQGAPTAGVANSQNISMPSAPFAWYKAM